MPAPKREAEDIAQTCLDCGQAQRRDLWPDSQHRQQTAPGLPTPASPRNRPHSHLIPATSPRNAAGLPNPLRGRSRCAPAACGRRGSQPGLAGSGSHSQTRRVAPVGETGRSPGPAGRPTGGAAGRLRERGRGRGETGSPRNTEKIHIPTERRGLRCVAPGHHRGPGTAALLPLPGGGGHATREPERRLPQQARAGFPRERTRAQTPTAS